MMLKNIRTMMTMLRKNPDIVGLIEFGSNPQSKDDPTGDYDLFAICRHKYKFVSSLHFYVNKIPVDLNFITLDELQRLDINSGFQFVALLDGRVIYDPTGEVKQALIQVQKREIHLTQHPLSEHSVARMRHGHKHIFDKLKGRLTTSPIFCQFLLNTTIFWLIQSYFRIHHLAYKGEKYTFNYLEQNEPELFQLIAQFHTTLDLNQKVKLAHQISEQILIPIDGM